MARVELKWSEALGEIIVERVRKGETVVQIARDCNLSVSTIQKWRYPPSPVYKKEFAEAYDLAMEMSAEVFEHKMLEEALNTKNDTYEDERKGGTVIRPNNCGPRRSEIIIQQYKYMAAIRNVRYRKTELMGANTGGQININVTNFADKKKPGDKKPEQAKEGIVSQNRISKEN